MTPIFKFELGQKVAILCSNETGEIIGRAEYKVGGTSYLLRYKAADGRACEAWWNEGAIG
jgi:hypothetical protein